MNNIRIYTLSDSNVYTDLVIPLFSENPLGSIRDLVNEGTLSNSDGMLLVDNIFRTGINNRRFFALNYSQGEVDFDSLKFLELDRKDTIRVTANQYLKEFPEIVNNSILSSAQKLLLLKGVSI
ncbi:MULTISPECIES: type II toxin-antitoxin system RnlB family antitoxin [Bacillus]|uniref:type II toxin-antitoxin system RnlB family antitoxin n=1 Tax=Bacillus TaxID=1386 RepID=UPI0015D4E92F|nr:MULTISPECIES: type II toxin-antitoxin system RnlB family antitoxin [Bacillus]